MRNRKKFAFFDLHSAAGRPPQGIREVKSRQGNRRKRFCRQAAARTRNDCGGRSVPPHCITPYSKPGGRQRPGLSPRPRRHSLPEDRRIKVGERNRHIELVIDHRNPVLPAVGHGLDFDRNPHSLVKSVTDDLRRAFADPVALDQEIVLVGINLSFYGIEYKLRLADAVETICAINGIKRVRLGSLEPEMINDEDIRRLAAQPKFCPQFHLSLQSGCDKTLKEMNRRYTTADYAELVQKLRDNFDNCAITTDVMVGFPNETEEDFKQSVEFVKKINFAKVHVFPYSQRKGTPAADFENQIPTSQKNIRAKTMSEAAEESRQKFLQSQSGLTFPVLFEREKADKIPHGYTPNYTLVKIFTKNLGKSLRNQIFYVKIGRIENDYCIGEIVSEQ